jgi:hypothetical protein
MTFKGVAGEDSTTFFSYFIRGMAADNQQNQLIKVENCVGYNCLKSGCFFENMYDFTFRNNWFHDVGWMKIVYPDFGGGDGIIVSNESDKDSCYMMLFEYNYMDKSAVDCKHGIIFGGDGDHNRDTVRFNKVKGFRGDSVSHYSPQNGVTINGCPGVQVYGNVFHDLYRGVYFWSYHGNDCDSARVYNNLIYNVWGFGIENEARNDYCAFFNNTIVQYADSMGSGNNSAINFNSGIDTCYNNIFYNEADDNEEVFVNTTNAVIDYNMAVDFENYTPNTNDTTDDAEFVDAAGGDFRLSSTSPAVDLGTDVGLTEDIQGWIVPLGTAPDLGCYERIQDRVMSFPSDRDMWISINNRKFVIE